MFQKVKLFSNAFTALQGLMVIDHCDHLNFKVKFRFLMFCRRLKAAFRRVRVYFDFICAPSLEYHHHLYTLCNQRSLMRFFVR